MCTREAKDFRDNLERFPGRRICRHRHLPRRCEGAAGVSQEQRPQLHPALRPGSSPCTSCTAPPKEHEKDGKETYETIRSTFVLDGDDTIRFAGYDVNVNGQIDELLEQIEKIK